MSRSTGPPIPDVCLEPESESHKWTVSGLFTALSNHQYTVHATAHLRTDILDDDGDHVEWRRFDTFGILQAATSPSEVYETVATMWGFTGRMIDSLTSLQFNRARWYDASIGRFICEDRSTPLRTETSALPRE